MLTETLIDDENPLPIKPTADGPEENRVYKVEISYSVLFIATVLFFPLEARDILCCGK